MIVDHFGFHEDGNLVFLLESGRGKCLTPGAESIPSPFEIRERTGANFYCPHRLFEPEPGIFNEHPLVMAMAPVKQEGKAYYIPWQNAPMVTRLLDMIGGSHARNHISFRGFSPLRNATRALTLTNAAPLVVTDYTWKNFQQIVNLVGEKRTRNLILCGPFKPYGAEELYPLASIDEDMNWSKVGAALTFEYILKVAHG